MNQKELKELIEFLIEKDIAEFELERGDVKVRVKRASDHVSAPPHMAFTHQAPAPPPPPEVATSPAPLTNTQKVAALADEGLHIVKSPIVGTLYESPSPGSPPFVKVGDSVEAGQVLCIIEAMKLMNEIESDVAGEIVKKLAANGQPVEYGQPLFAIRQK
jgi:acetyl-CoA carboxylase biotin carboxyl carrier protein